MGVLTTLYAVPAPLMKKIREDNERLAFLFGEEEDEDEKRWKVASYDLEKKAEEQFSIYATAGYPTMQAAFDFESAEDDEPEYDGYDIRVAKPATVKKIAKEIEKATPKQLVTKGVAARITDYYGKPMSEFEIEFLVDDVARLKKFFAKAAEAGHFVIAAAQ
jgi:hypothetical protein